MAAQSQQWALSSILKRYFQKEESINVSLLIQLEISVAFLFLITMSFFMVL